MQFIEDYKPPSPEDFIDRTLTFEEKKELRKLEKKYPEIPFLRTESESAKLKILKTRDAYECIDLPD